MIAALVPAILLGIALLSTRFALYLKLWVDYLAMGFSDSKTFVLLLFLTLLLACRKLPSPWRASWNVAFPVGILLLWLIALVERYLFVRTLGPGAWSRFQAAVSGGRFSTTRLAHLHEPKACLAWLTGYRGTELDSGFQFLPYLPSSLLAVQLLLVGLVVIVAFLASHHLGKTETVEAQVCLAMGVFAMTKATLDGGPFSTESWVPVFFVLGLLFDQTGAKVGAALAVVFLPFSVWLFGGEWGYGVLKILGGFLVLGAPLLWRQMREAGSTRGYLVAVAYLGVLLTLPWLQYRLYDFAKKPPFTQGTIVYASTVLVTGEELSIFSPTPAKAPAGAAYEIVATWKGNSFYILRAKVLRPVTPREICDELGLNVNWHPVNWFRGLIYYDFVGTFSRPLPTDWPASQQVVAYATEEVGPLTRIHLCLRGGGDLTAGFDALPLQNFVVTDFRWTSGQRPQLKWKPGPAWSESQPEWNSRATGNALPPARVPDQ